VADNEPPADIPPAPEPPGRPPPPPITWETEQSTRSQESSSMGTAALDIVRTVIHGDKDE
jgi:hypothetical protein